jgi:hypothetical protein
MKALAIALVSYHFSIAVWRPKAAQSDERERLGADCRQAQRIWMELGLCLSDLIPTGERSGLLMHIAMMESVSLCVRGKGDCVSGVASDGSRLPRIISTT